MKKRTFCGLMLASLLGAATTLYAQTPAAAPAAAPVKIPAVPKLKLEKGFKKIFDGKTMTGWKMADENQNAWSIQDGYIKANGSRSHLYYVGDDKPFKNFELKVDVLTEPVSNGGIYIQTAYQALSWPKQGFEIQVNQTHGDWKKTGSIYDVVNVKENFAQDLVWYNYHIIVNGKHITVKINDKVAVDYEEPADRQPGKDFARMIGEGTFAFQAHDPKSVVRYTNVRVKRLP